MQPRKLSIHFAFFAYGGNGGIATINPHLRPWWARTLKALEQDPRIEKDGITDATYWDTPIDMMRNQAVLKARELGADVIVMIDSDNTPDRYLERDGAKPFVPSSFDFLYDHFDKGPVCIAAPYCGPPPNELVYIFQWTNRESDHANPDFKLDMVSRAQASRSRGIQEVGALPTGVMMADMRVFELTEPQEPGDKPWFHYEFSDKYCARKNSTEDVVFSRDISLCGYAKLNYNPVFCNWDAWAGHVKQKEVGPPSPLGVDSINLRYRRAFERGETEADRLVVVHDDDFNPADHPPIPKELLAEQGRMPAPGSVVPFPKVVDRVVAGIPVKSLGFNTPGEDFESLATLAGNVARKCVPGETCRILEIGSWVGETAIALQRVASLSNPFITVEVDCVDAWSSPGSDGTESFAQQFGGWDVVHDHFLSNTKPLSEFITGHRCTSAEWAERIDGQYYDLIFIDGDHTYDGCKADIERWLLKVRDGGIISGHDLGDQFPGVAGAIRDSLAPLYLSSATPEAFRVPGGKVWAAKVDYDNCSVAVSPLKFTETTKNSNGKPKETASVS